jgi:hypothetical protein
MGSWLSLPEALVGVYVSGRRRVVGHLVNVRECLEVVQTDRGRGVVGLEHAVP